jgi:hypothetical protein
LKRECLLASHARPAQPSWVNGKSSNDANKAGHQWAGRAARAGSADYSRDVLWSYCGIGTEFELPIPFSSVLFADFHGCFSPLPHVEYRARHDPDLLVIATGDGLRIRPVSRVYEIMPVIYFGMQGIRGMRLVPARILRVLPSSCHRSFSFGVSVVRVTARIAPRRPSHQANLLRRRYLHDTQQIARAARRAQIVRAYRPQNHPGHTQSTRQR